MERSVTLNGPEPAPSPETLALRQLLAERDRLVDEQAESIRDLRHRLDAEAEARRLEAEERRRLTTMLTDQRSTRSPWWRRWGR